MSTYSARAGILNPGLSDRLESSALAVRQWPDLTDPQWRRTDALLDVGVWADLGHRYSRWIGTRHRAPGLACAAQHYSGRFVLPVVTAWCADSSLLNPDHRRWWACVDERGATGQMALPGWPVIGRDPDPAVLAAHLMTHLGPIVAAVVAAGQLTRRVVLGCVAASVASAFATAYRGTEPAARPAVAQAQERVLATLDCPSGRATASVVRLVEPDALSYDRHTCCLIRLGRDRDLCGSCPQLPVEERRRRQAAHARTAAAAIDLTGLGA